MKIKIVGDGTPRGTRVLAADGRDLSGKIKGCSWRHDAGELPLVEVELMLVEIEVSGRAKMIGPGGREVRRIEYVDGDPDEFPA